MSWDDPRTEEADLVILRATWDYAARRDEFLAWTRRVPNLLNAADVVAWNSDKRYLNDLAEAGIPTVPSWFLQPGDPISLPNGELVVKPAIGAGSIDTLRFADTDAARMHAAALLDAGRGVLVQPYDARIEDGETALVFLGGRQSHAFTKGPMLGPQGSTTPLVESGTYAQEVLTVAEPDFEMWDLGYTVLDAAASHLGILRSEFLYARVDLIGSAQAAVVLELELIEPSLGWLQLDEAARELRQRDFALQVEAACERLGLGPLSHRRP